MVRRDSTVTAVTADAITLRTEAGRHSASIGIRRRACDHERKAKWPAAPSAAALRCVGIETRRDGMRCITIELRETRSPHLFERVCSETMRVTTSKP